MRRVLFSLVLLAITSMATPAVAQLATGRSGSSTTSVSNSEQVYLENLWMYGSCFADSRRDDTRALLATSPGSAEEGAVYARLRGAKLFCVGEEMYFDAPVQMLRGAVAEGAYRKMVKHSAAPILRSEPSGPLATTFSDGMRCYVAGHAAEAHALIYETKPGSGKEERAINAMLADYFRCLSPRVAVDMSAVEFRYGVAEALYHAVSPETRGTK